MTKVRMFGMGLALLAGLLVAAPLVATADKEDKEKDRPKQTDEAKAQHNLAMADQLIAYGLTNKSPTALLAAAEIMFDNQVKTDDKRVKKVEGPKDAKEAKPMTPADVVAKAREIAKDAKEYDALIAATEARIKDKPRSPFPNPVVIRYGHLDGRQRRSYWVHCHGHTHAHVTCTSGWCDLDLYVYNSAGQLIRSDTSTSPHAFCHWNGDGDFRIEVFNYSYDCHAHYTLRVD